MLKDDTVSDADGAESNDNADAHNVRQMRNTTACCDEAIIILLILAMLRTMTMLMFTMYVQCATRQ